MTPAVARALDLHEPFTPGANASEEDKAKSRYRNRVRGSILEGSWPHKIAAFRELFQLSQHNAAVVGQLSDKRVDLQTTMLEEELHETIDAAADGDWPELVDGLLDTIYVALGFLLELGLTPGQINQLMDEVHASNMTKVDAFGKPVYSATGKVLKGDHFVKPDIAAMLQKFSAAQQKEVS